MDEKELHLELYKLAVDGANKISERRGVMNGLFITINGAILGFIGTNTQKMPIIILACIFGVLIALAWTAKIIGYRDINSAKFHVICKIEKDFFPIKIFGDENIRLKTNKGYSLTKYEVLLPIIFFIIYVIISLYFLKV